MLSHIMTQLFRSFGIFFRTIRAFFTRRLVGLWSRLRQLTNFSRQATKIASDSLQSAASMVKNPTSREDYVQAGRLLIAKRLILMLIAGLVAAGLLVYFVIWPFLLGHFLTAHFYVRDSRIENWTGRVIVYSDEAKKIPLYEGKLTEGQLQGSGKQYDENGLLLYDGSFTNGVREGKGKAYEAGTLVYEGNFAADLYEGNGKRYQNGAVCYEGGFTGGLRSGEGMAFYENGAVQYKGAFADDLYEGNGTAYTEDGVKTYEGGFSQGVYSGQGKLYRSDDQYITANFVEGRPSGPIQWYKGGKLYYDGGAAGLVPSGTGILYAPNGQTAYIGQMANGTVDGAWLVSLTAQEFREALGESKTVEYGQISGGFVIAAPAMGLSALCSYQTTAQEPAVHSVYLSTPRNSVFTLLPDGDIVTTEGWPEPVAGTVYYNKMEGVNTESGSYNSRFYDFESCQAELLSVTVTEEPEEPEEPEESEQTEASEETGQVEPVQKEQAVQLRWSLPYPMADTASTLPDSTGADAEKAKEQQEQFLESLDAMAGTGAATASAGETARMSETLADLGLTAGGGSEGAEEGGAANPYYGEGAVTDALLQCGTAANASSAVDAMVSFWENAERRSALESNLARTIDQLAEAQNALASGNGSQDTVTALEETQNSLNNAISACIAETAKASVQASDAGAPDLAGLALSDTAVVFDPTSMDVSELALVATAYAHATGKSGTDEDICTSLKMALADLTVAYNDVQSALSSYQSAGETVTAIAGKYAMGLSTKNDWYAAMSAQSDCQAALCSAIAAFTRQANQLNHLTGGWVSRTQQWMADTLPPLYEAEAERYQAEQKKREEQRKLEEQKKQEQQKKQQEQKQQEQAQQEQAQPEPKGAMVQEQEPEPVAAAPEPESEPASEPEKESEEE